MVLVLAALLIRLGLAMYAAGLTRAKNSAGTVLRMIADLAVGTLAAYLVGSAFVMLTTEGPVSRIFLHLYSADLPPQVLMITLLAPLAGGLVVGAVTERSRFIVVLATSAILGGIVVPLHMTWGQLGWIHRKLNFDDPVGLAAIHIVGGVAALVLARAVGPRENKYHRDGSASVIPGHSLPLATLGSLVLCVGLVLLTSGGGGVSSLNAILAAAAGTVTALSFSVMRFGKPDVLLIVTGLLGATVAGGVGAVNTPPIVGLLIGIVAGVLVPLTAVQLDLRLRIDDPTSAVSIHLVGGLCGLLAAGLFHPNREFGQRMLGMLGQGVGFLLAAGLAIGASLAIATALKGKLRSPEADEFDGLDLAEHDVGAYPDFQQNTIRSYHLREA